MYPFDKENPLRKISIALFFPLCWKIGIRAEAITILNFLIFGLLTIFYFAIGKEYIALLFALLTAMFDYVDGTVGRAGRGSPLGAYLDISLDYLYLMLIILSISFHNNMMIIGYVILLCITFSNWVQYNGNVNIKLPFPLTIQFIIPTSVILGCSGAGIALISTIQVGRTILLYKKSLCLFPHK